MFKNQQHLRLPSHFPEARGFLWLHFPVCLLREQRGLLALEQALFLPDSICRKEGEAQHGWLRKALPPKEASPEVHSEQKSESPALSLDFGESGFVPSWIFSPSRKMEESGGFERVDEGIGKRRLPNWGGLILTL